MKKRAHSKPVYRISLRIDPWPHLPQSEEAPLRCPASGRRCFPPAVKIMLRGCVTFYRSKLRNYSLNFTYLHRPCRLDLEADHESPQLRPRSVAVSHDVLPTGVARVGRVGEVLNKFLGVISPKGEGRNYIFCSDSSLSLVDWWSNFTDP